MTAREAVTQTTASFWMMVRDTASEIEANPDPIIYYDLDRDGVVIDIDCQEFGFAPGVSPKVIKLAKSYKPPEADYKYSPPS